MNTHACKLSKTTIVYKQQVFIDRKSAGDHCAKEFCVTTWKTVAFSQAAEASRKSFRGNAEAVPVAFSGESWAVCGGKS